VSKISGWIDVALMAAAPLLIATLIGIGIGFTFSGQIACTAVQSSLLLEGTES
jgi:hypothetical protein